jgi:uncharacterized membrane protein
MREAVAADPRVAVENIRVRKRRNRESLLDDSEQSEQRDPGYSQAVRRACQQRLVQLIPVRASTLCMVIMGLWILWAGLLGAHYWFHIRPSANSQPIPISYLLHLRSTHGIAHWLGCQLWMLTGLASIMIFQLRRHKLDDYRAKYRLWAVLAIAALVSSLDVSSSGLFLLGKSLDSWTLREVGYPGWTVVLASFATLVGVLGLRLCSELKSAPVSVGFWMIGLLSWGGSALLGTELIKSPWSKPVTDLIVGGAWLGGILAVFLAAGIYLRQIYIEAQKRFLMRSRMSQSRAWKLPKLGWKSRTRDEESVEPTAMEKRSASRVASRSRREEVIDESDVDEVEFDEEPTRRRRWLPRFGFSRDRREGDLDDEAAESQTDRPSGRSNSRSELVEENSRESKQPWIRMPRWKSNPKLGSDFSDVDAARRVRDDGFDAPMPKKSGWFSKRSDSQGQESTEASDSKTARYGSATIASDQSDEPKSGRRRWFGAERRAKNPEEKKGAAAKSGQTSKVDKPKRNWSLWKKGGSTTISPEVADRSSKSTSSSKDEKSKRNWMGMFDGLKLKPPKPSDSSASPKTVPSNLTSIPSSSQAQRHDSRPAAASNSAPFKPAYDDDGGDDSNYRNLSKAERKKLRRQQQDNRRAA